MATRDDPQSTVHVRIVASTDELKHCFAIRRAVFVHEQQVDEAIEIDGLDDACIQFLAEGIDHQPIGTARLRISAEKQAKAQRVAVLKEHRNKGIGAKLMAAIESHAQSLGHDAIHLNAQVSALHFYRQLGYVVCGDPFIEANIEHLPMKKCLDRGTHSETGTG